MNNTTSTIAKNFKATYLRLLGGEQQPAQADYWAARELIDNGYATGHYHVSREHLNHGDVTDVLAFAPTMAGRMLADELAEQLRKSSKSYRVRQAAFGLLSFGAGWVFGVFSQVAANLMTKALGG